MIYPYIKWYFTIFVRISRRKPTMMTDIEIADRAEMKPIKEIAAQIGLGEDDIEQYGKYKA